MSDASDSDSDEDGPDLAALQAAAVSWEVVTAGAQRVADQGQQRLGNSSKLQQRPAGDTTQQAGDGEGSDEDDEPPEELGIIERRIAGFLDKRIEQHLVWCASCSQRLPVNKQATQQLQQQLHQTQPQQPNKPSSTAADIMSNGQESLGCGVRLFRHAPMGLVTLKPAEAPVPPGSLMPAAQLLDIARHKRAQREAEAAAALCACLMDAQVNASWKVERDDATRAASRLCRDPPGLAGFVADGGPDSRALVSAATAAAKRLKRLSEHEAGSLQAIKCMRRELKHCAVDGSQIVACALNSGWVVAAEPASLSRKQVKAQRQGKCQGLVVEGKAGWVPYEVRTARLLGLPVDMQPRPTFP
ncbi:hypothetical protein V8C86DRAFT_2475853 [Haematococcus lacustris]